MHRAHAPPVASLKYTFTRSSCRSESPMYVPSAPIPCSSQITCARCERRIRQRAIQSRWCVIAAHISSHFERSRRARELVNVARTSQNFAPIWLPHCPPWMCTISL